MRGGRKEPLYRKVNTLARGVHHHTGGEYRWARGRGKGVNLASEMSMGGKKRRGLDYTPLFRFLLSKVGQDWNAVYSEAVSRLDKDDPVWWMVARSDAERRPWFVAGEASYYNGLYVDETGKLALVDPDLRNEDLTPSCRCCTHTFNGKPFVNRYAEP
ncbi:MAG: hypothetical protein KDJ74_10165 [Notoacmeibacter sp.]|nr:hypothetical protein [Notoacmeibacter sp.]